METAITVIEIICTILGLVQGVLAMFDKRSNWIVYAVMMSLLAIFSAARSLWGDVLLNSIYLGICIWSFIMWSPGSAHEKISRMTFGQNVLSILVTILLTWAGGRLLSGTDDPLPYIDAFTTVTTFVALLMMTWHKLECWIVWLINDIAYIVQYFMLPDQALYLAGLYTVWTIMALVSLRKWREIYLWGESGQTI